MGPKMLFYVFIGIILIKYIFDTVVNAMNARRFNDPIPAELKGVYEDKEYQKSQRYKSYNYKFAVFSSAFSIILTLVFFFFDGFRIVDDFARGFSDHSIVVGLIFFGLIMFGSDILNLPFSYYKTFVIEERFGFNKTTHMTFILDKLKSWGMTVLIGGGILSLITWIYGLTQANFWLYAWGVISLFTVFMNLFYSKLIVPLFNTQTTLEDGPLKQAIEAYARKVGFELENIYVINGSKRSTKANAYFSGFGRQKRITLYDTLINDLETDEIVAVLAHEVGHYKKRHVIFNLVESIVMTGITLFIFSLLVGNIKLSQALSVESPSFHIGLIAFAILYSPISEVTGFLMNILSRKFEYQADNYASTTFNSSPLISALKKLSRNSLSNLTPHPLYVKLHYSHPTLYQRILHLKK